MTPCLNEPKHQTQPSTDSGGQGECVSVSGQSEVTIHAGLVETLLAAATRENELVTKLLRAFVRNDGQGVLAVATAIAISRGGFPTDGVLPEVEASVTGHTGMPRPDAYRDKLLVAIQREEILLESLVAAVVGGKRAKLFSLCRNLADNRKQFDPDFRRANNFPEDLSP